MTGCLRELNSADGLIDGLMTGHYGSLAVKLAVQNNCQHFIAVPDVQQHLQRQWNGRKLISLEEIHTHYNSARSARSGRSNLAAALLADTKGDHTSGELLDHLGVLTYILDGD